MTDKDVAADASLDIPDTKGGISRAGNGGLGVRHLKTTDSGSVTSQSVDAIPEKSQQLIFRRFNKVFSSLPGTQIPDPHITITAAADKDVFPWDHSPYAHDMAL